jgi:hypothetical protein
MRSYLGNSSRTFVFGAVCTLALCAQNASALSVPYTENFDADSANWRANNSTIALGWTSGGGPEASSYATTDFNFLNSGSGSTPTIFRNQDEFNSSGLNFQGNWVTGDVVQLSFYVRHNAGVNMTFFVRFADPANFPGAAVILSPPVPSGTWTQLTVNLDTASFIYEGPFTYNDVFDNIGHIQIGVSTPQSLVNQNQTATFDIDRPSIAGPAPVPTVSEWGLVAMALTGVIAGTIMFRRGVC